MRSLQALELALRRQVNDMTLGHRLESSEQVNAREYLRANFMLLADQVQLAALEADDADGDEQAKRLDQLENYRRIQS